MLENITSAKEPYMADLRANSSDADMQAEGTLNDDGMEKDPIDPSKCVGLLGYWLSASTFKRKFSRRSKTSFGLRYLKEDSCEHSCVHPVNTPVFIEQSQD